MENKNIITLKRHPRDLHFDNPVYRNQLDDDDSIYDYVVIDVTSHARIYKEFMREHPNFVKEISPFYIGPVISSDGVKANIFELFWQCGKVYPCHDDGGKPNEEYFKWRNEFYSKTTCNRHIMRHTCESIGCEHSDTLYFAFFNKEKNEWEALDYVQSRKKVYWPEYAKLVANTESYKWIKNLVDSGKKVALLDFDVYNYHSENGKRKKYESYINKCKKNATKPAFSESQVQDIKTLKDVINTPFLLCGHGFVLKALLQGDIEVMEDGTVKDNGGLFE
ncbi:MAG: hypothetical protein K5765_08855 [Clostridia bacterium]|nr:hypothetical protein [Clostridia bacterium]